MWVRRPRLPHTTSQDHCVQDGRDTINTCCVPGPRHRDTTAQTHWGQSTIWRGHTRPTTSPKEGKRRGYISKEFCANADLCPLAKPATQNLRWPSEGKGTTIGSTTGIVMCQCGVAMMDRTSGHKGPSPQRLKPTNACRRIVPSSSRASPTIWGNQCGLNDRD